MAISAEQAAAISTAIENLNKSVQVNEEVLQIIKSMQTTGAAGTVAEHNADECAHKVLEALQLKNNLVVAPTLASSLSFTPAYAELFSKKITGGLNSTLHLVGASDVITAEPVGIRLYSNKPDMSQGTFENARFGSISFITRYAEGPSIKTFVRGLLSCQSNAGDTRMILGISDKSESTIQYYFKVDSLSTTKALDLGSTTYQWKDLYLQNSPTVSSDRRLKQDFSAVPEAVFKAWEKVNFCQYKFKEAVEKKGAEARLHVGLIAQEILEAFEAQGLDATKYGIVCHDSWEDQYQDVEVGTKPAVLNEKGEVVKPEEPIMEHQFVKPAGDLWTVRYEEALALECAYQRWKLQKMEAALKAKGIEL